jgi:hypothetical protein
MNFSLCHCNFFLLVAFAMHLLAQKVSALNTGQNIRYRGHSLSNDDATARQLKAPVIVGDNGKPSSAFPLSKCQGDWWVLTNSKLVYCKKIISSLK